jgi:mono/diheme cytochrome c family protein
LQDKFDWEDGMTRSRSFLMASLVFGMAVAAACFLSTSASAQGDGEKVYKAKCTSCHGPDGAGATPAGKATKARDFCSDEAKKETDAEWTSIILQGKNKMPGYDKKITDAEVKEVVAYIRGLCKK